MVKKTCHISAASCTTQFHTQASTVSNLLTDGMLAGILLKHFLKVWRTYGQDNFVGLNQLPFARYGQIHQVASVKQLLEATGNIVLKIVPAQGELIHFCTDFTSLLPLFTQLTGLFTTLLSLRKKWSRFSPLNN